MEYVRANIEHLRGHRSINQVAEAAGIHQSWLQRFMNPTKSDGIKKPNPDKLTPVAKVLGVSLQALLHEDLTQAAPSQPVRVQRDTMRAAARIMERAREVIIGDVDEDALIDSALDAAEEVGPDRILSGEGLMDALRLVAAKARTA